MSGSRPADVVNDVRPGTGVPAAHDVIDSALHLVVTLARATVRGADGVSASLCREGRLSTVAATDQTILDIDTRQYATGQGPCVAASMEGRWVHVEALDTESRWPDFSPAALELGISAILSTPLRSEGRPVGAINLYSRTARAFAVQDQELASLFSAETSIVLTSAGVCVPADAVSERLHQDALRAREVIAQAQGALMERGGLNAEDAFTLLRNLSEQASVSLRHRADQVVASTCRPTGPRSQLQGRLRG